MVCVETVSFCSGIVLITQYSGGGIAGLTFAIALYRFAPADAPFQVDIYEADAEVRTVGAGITVWPRTWSVMRHLGLYEELSRVAVQASGGSANDVPSESLVRGTWKNCLT